MKIFILLFCAALTAVYANPVIENMQANTWYEVPNTRMQAVCPSESQFPGICGICCCCDGVVSLWSGGAFDQKRNTLIVWGGGHRGYYGNELYTFDLDDFKWTRVTNPSTPNDPDVCARILLGGTPVARHTYYNIDYISSVDRFFCGPVSGTACMTGMYDEATWMFAFDTADWNGPQYGWKYMRPTGDPAPHSVSDALAYDPVTNKVYYCVMTASNLATRGLWSYDVQTNHWAQLNAHNIGSWSDKGAAVDTKRGLFIVVGSGKVVAYDIRNLNYSPQTWSTSGGGSVVSGRPGVNYDPKADRIVAWDGGSVYALNVDTKVWEQKASAPQPAASNGTYGRFRYSIRENAYVVVNDVDKNVLIYKLTAGPGTDPGAVETRRRPDNGGLAIAAEPNPFNGTIKIAGSGQRIADSNIGIAIYDIKGKMIQRLSATSYQLSAGITWSPSGLPAGIYIARLSAGNRSVSKKLFLNR